MSNLTLDDLRPEVAAFAILMERELRANDHKPGWKQDRLLDLWSHLKEEVREVEAFLRDGWRDLTGGIPTDGERETIGEELADVGNMAMMVADVCGALPPAPEQGHLCAALEALMAEPHGCRFCDYGTLREWRGPDGAMHRAEAHDPGCEWEAARAAVARAREAMR